MWRKGALLSVRADSREAFWSVLFAIRDSDRAFIALLKEYEIHLF